MSAKGVQRKLLVGLALTAVAAAVAMGTAFAHGGDGPGPGFGMGCGAGLTPGTGNGSGMEQGCGTGYGPGMRHGAGPGPGAGGLTLLTNEERAAHRAKMQSLASYDECKAYLADFSKEMQARAKEKRQTVGIPNEAMCDRMKAHGRFTQ